MKDSHALKNFAQACLSIHSPLPLLQLRIVKAAATAVRLAWTGAPVPSLVPGSVTTKSHHCHGLLTVGFISFPGIPALVGQICRLDRNVSKRFRHPCPCVCVCVSNSRISSRVPLPSTHVPLSDPNVRLLHSILDGWLTDSVEEKSASQIGFGSSCKVLQEDSLATCVAMPAPFAVCCLCVMGGNVDPVCATLHRGCSVCSWLAKCRRGQTTLCARLLKAVTATSAQRHRGATQAIQVKDASSKPHCSRACRCCFRGGSGDPDMSPECFTTKHGFR